MIWVSRQERTSAAEWLLDAPHLRLLVALKRSGKRHGDVAQAVGITPKHLSRLVNGHADLRAASSGILEGLSRELGVSQEDLLGVKQQELIG